MAKSKQLLIDPADVSRIIEMAWEDRPHLMPFCKPTALNESEVIELMRQEMQAGPFGCGAKRVTGRSTKHAALRGDAVQRAYCPTQYKPKYSVWLTAFNWVL